MNIIEQAIEDGKTNATLMRVWHDDKYNYSAEDWLNNKTGQLHKNCWIITWQIVCMGIFFSIVLTPLLWVSIHQLSVSSVRNAMVETLMFIIVEAAICATGALLIFFDWKMYLALRKRTLESHLRDCGDLFWLIVRVDNKQYETPAMQKVIHLVFLREWEKDFSEADLKEAAKQTLIRGAKNTEITSVHVGPNQTVSFTSSSADFLHHSRVYIRWGLTNTEELLEIADKAMKDGALIENGSGI